MSHDRRELLQALAEKMASVVRRVHAGQGFKFSEFILRPPQVRILFFIARQNEEVAVKDLAEMLNVTPGAVTQFVDGMVDMDLVRREEDAKDRRIIRVKLTELARSKLREFRKSYLTAASRAFDVLSDAEIGELVRLLNKVDINPVRSESEDDFESR
ncbi:MarR family winged helix-turn-helix transcriptional regulator [Chloroflexota bacterium]